MYHKQNQTNQYDNINSLLSNSNEAKEFYLSLPDYVIGQLTLHSDSIHSYEDLKSYATKIVES